MFAKKHNLVATIGSDFHDYDAVSPVIGLVGEDIDIDSSYIDDVLNCLKQK